MIIRVYLIIFFALRIKIQSDMLLICFKTHNMRHKKPIVESNDEKHKKWRETPQQSIIKILA
jgi:hypothetical protein